MIRKALRLAAFAATFASPAPAFEMAAGLGVDDLRGDPGGAVGLELRTGAIWSNAHFSLGLGVAAENDDDFWAGAGPVVTAPLAPRWRLELSVMLGGYNDGGGNDLGAEFPMFRSQLGVSYALSPLWRLGLAANHKSNARTAERNPGVETLFLTLARRF